MELWITWTAFIEDCLKLLYVQLGLSEAIAIIVFTLAARALLMPVSLLSALRACDKRAIAKRLQPKLEELKIRYQSDPRQLARKTMALYKREGMTFLDKPTMLNIGSQGILGIGIFQVLKDLVVSSKFLWIANIARPDFALAVLIGLLTFLSMFLMPAAPEQGGLLLFLVPALVLTFVAMTFPSAIGLYWATSSIVGLGQSVVLRHIISKRNRELPDA